MSTQDAYLNGCQIDLAVLLSADFMLSEIGCYGSPLVSLKQQLGIQCVADLVESVVLHDEIFVPLRSSKPLRAYERWKSPSYKILSDNKVLNTFALDSDEFVEITKSYMTALDDPSALTTLKSLAEDILRLPEAKSISPMVLDTLYGQFLMDYPEIGPGLDWEFEDEYTGRNNRPLFYDENKEMSPEQRDDLVRNLALFLLLGLRNSSIARYRHTPYFSHPLRTQAIMRDGLVSGGLLDSFSQTTNNLLLDLRNELAQKKNDAIKKHLWEIDIPPIFSLVIRNSDKASHLLETAMQIRDSKGARAFRAWSNNVTRSIFDNRGDIADQALKDFEQVRQEFAKEFKETDKVNVTLWILEVPVSMPGILKKRIWLPREQHIQFMYETTRRSLDVMRLADEIERVFKLH